MPTQPDLSQCQFAVMSGSEVINSQFLQLTPAEASHISSFVLLVWGTAWGFKQLANFIKGDTHVSD
ncbi:hypothetical protein [Solimicrobium silvestre]|nr:hypothetical protein [Solimicrobium silvestre]